MSQMTLFSGQVYVDTFSRYFQSDLAGFTWNCRRPVKSIFSEKSNYFKLSMAANAPNAIRINLSHHFPRKETNICLLSDAMVCITRVENAKEIQKAMLRIIKQLDSVQSDMWKPSWNETSSCKRKLDIYFHDFKIMNLAN